MKDIPGNHQPEKIIIGLNEDGDHLAVFRWPDWANNRLNLELDGMSLCIQEKPVVIYGNRWDPSSGG